MKLYAVPVSKGLNEDWLEPDAVAEVETLAAVEDLATMDGLVDYWD